MNWINANNSTAPLLADGAVEVSPLKIIATNTTVGHDSFIKDTSVEMTGTQFPSTSKIDVGKIAFIEVCFTDSSISKDGFSKIDLNKATLPENSISKIYPWHVTSAETTLIHAGADKLSKAHITFVEPTSNKIGVTEVGFLVNTTSNDVINPKGTSKVSSREVLFSSSILSNQFFSIHN